MKNLFFLFLLIPSLFFSQSDGRLDLTYQTQVNRANIDSLSSDFIVHNFFLNLYQNVGYLGYLNASLNMTMENSHSRIGFYAVNWQDIPLGPFRLQAGLGITSFRLSSLEPFDSFNHTSWVGLKGAVLAFHSQRTSFLFFGGELLQPSYSWGEGEEQSGGSIWGLKGIFRLTADWTMGLGCIRVSRLPVGGEPDKKFDGHLLTMDGSLRIWRQFFFLSDFKYAIPTKAEEGNEFSLKIGPYFRSQRFLFQFYYQRLSPDFPNLEQSHSSDRQGYTFYGEYRPITGLMLFASVDTFDENLERIWNRSISEYLTYSVGSSLGLGSLPILSLRISRSEQQASRSGIDTANNSFQFFSFSAFKNFRLFFLSLRLNLGRFQDKLDPGQNTHLEDYAVEARHFFLNGSFVYLHGVLSRQKKDPTGLITSMLYLQLGSTINLTPSWYLNASLNLNSEQTNISPEKTNGFSLEGGLGYEWRAAQLSLALHYRYSRNRFTQAEALAQTYHQLYVSVTKSFHWGKRGPRASGLSARIPTGNLEGRTFVDLNHNGKVDSREDILAGIDIWLDGRVAARSNEGGFYSIKDIPYGRYRLTVDLRLVPAYYMPIGGETRVLDVTGRKTQIVDFAFAPVGMVSGRVILDVNENGKPDQNEPPVDGIMISVFRGDERLGSMPTNSSGLFRFDQLFAGRYRLEIDPQELAESFAVGQPAGLDIELQDGQELRNLVLMVKKNQKPKEKKIFEFPKK